MGFVSESRSIKMEYDRFLGNVSACSRSVNFVSNLVLVALTVIGAMAVAGVLSTAAMSYTTLSLGVAYFGIKLMGGHLKSRVVDLVASAAIAIIVLVFGTCGTLGMFTAEQMGYALLGNTGLTIVSSMGLMIWAKHWAKKQRDKLDYLG